MRNKSMKTVVLPKPYHQIFEDAAKAFDAEDGEDTLCFGVQDWTVAEIQFQRNLAPGRLIAYQSEPLFDGNLPFRNVGYIEKLKLFDEVWEYSVHNLDYLRQHGVANVIYKTLLPSEALRETPLEKDIDIFHFGSLSRHRTEMLNVAISKGFRVYDLISEHHKMLYGEELHQLIRRSKVVLGLHFYPESPLQECFRYQYPLSNDVMVLAEKSLSNPLGLEEFADADEMVAKLKRLINPNPITRDQVLEQYVFAQYDSYIEEAKKCCQSEELSVWLAYVAKYMNADLEKANEMKRLAKRSKDVKAIELKVFDDLMRVSLLLIRQRNALGKQASSFSSEFGRIYRKLQKHSVKEVLLSTGGKTMPRLRCLLLLHGWGLMKLSLRLSVALHRDKKFIRYCSNETSL